jgi:hypothetical protein
MMTAAETIQLAQRHGVRLWVHQDKIRVESENPPPEGLMAALRENKSVLLALLPSGCCAEYPPMQEPPTPVRRCPNCKGTEFWERPPELWGGLVCARCHPKPQNLCERCGLPHFSRTIAHCHGDDVRGAPQS